MGYACPVCEDPQSDARHIANHLGFTAVARGGDHEKWLDEHVPGWGGLDEDALAEQVVEFAEDVDYPQVFEDTTGQPRTEHAHRGHGQRGQDQSTAGGGGAASDVPVDVATVDEGDLDADVAEVVQEARELTRRRREDSETE